MQMHLSLPEKAKVTDRLQATNQPTVVSHAQPVTLRGRGQTWGLLFDDGRFLEVQRGEKRVTFDLWESIRLGRAVIWRVDDGD